MASLLFALADDLHTVEQMQNINAGDDVREVHDCGVSVVAFGVIQRRNAARDPAAAEWVL